MEGSGPATGGDATQPSALRFAVAFVTTLRAAGLDVPTDATVTYARALAAVEVSSREQVYWAGRATLIRRPEDASVYDATFAAFFTGLGSQRLPSAPIPKLVTIVEADDEEAAEMPQSADGPSPVVQVRFSQSEMLRHKDFARCTHAELVEAQRMMAMMRFGGVTRKSCRRRPARRGDQPDVRGTVRGALRTGGEPLERRWRARTERPRRVVLLCDVSGSMAPYARALLRFLHVAVVGRQRVEAFTLGTRLTRVTRSLQERDPDAALAAAADTVEDWSSGTRLGEALRTFNDRYGLPGLARGAVVVVLSDGWDLGNPDLLGAEMARLRRVAHRVVWANPLKASPGYQPLARGMAAALPHVDDFIEGHSVASLEALGQLVADIRVPIRGDVAP
jgi:uncharacterized protein with von Willebrand factor type A (vWA) domain